MATTAFRQAGLKAGTRAIVALAAGLLIVLCAFAAPSLAAKLDARDYKMAGDALHTRLVLNFDGEPDPKFLLLRAPHRLVIDLPETRLVLDPRELKPRGLVAGVRYGNLDEQTSRLIITAKGPFTVERSRSCPTRMLPATG